MKIGKKPSIGGLLIFGTTTSSFAKLVYELQSVGIDGELKHFRKPWAMTAVMFLGMSLCLPLAYQDKQEKPMDLQAIMAELQDSLLIAIPAGFDLVATVLMNVGLLSVTASVYQMLRGACMLFAAMFAVIFLKRQLNGLHFSGISLAIVGIALVGFSSLLATDPSSADSMMGSDSGTVLMGMALIVLSQAAQAGQITCEDWLMKTKGVTPLKIVGWEGVYGFAAMALLMLPAAHLLLPGLDGEGLHENFFDTLQMVRDSHTLQMVLGVDMVAFLAYNVAGMGVTENFGGVYRSVLETLRTLFVWLVSLGMYYTLDGRVGEALTEHSYLQGLGFAVLVVGTLVYGRGNVQRAEEERQLHAAERAAAAAQDAAAHDISVNPSLSSSGISSKPLPTFKFTPTHKANVFEPPPSSPAHPISQPTPRDTVTASSKRETIRMKAVAPPLDALRCIRLPSSRGTRRHARRSHWNQRPSKLLVLT